MTTRGQKLLLLTLFVGVVASLMIFKGEGLDHSLSLSHISSRSRSTSEPPKTDKNNVDVASFAFTGSQSALQPTNNGEKKVAAYNFSAIEKYLENLFPPCNSTNFPDTPAFLTAFSSNHFEEGRAMIDNFRKTVLTRYPDLKFYFFDLGLSEREAIEIQKICNCTCRPFPFHEFPKHVEILYGYAWKPLAIQLVLKEHPFVIWMDTSIRFTTPNIDKLIYKAKTKGILTRKGVTRLVSHTLPSTFQQMNTDPHMFRAAIMFSAGFIVIRATPYVTRYILQPWMSCALKLGCMVPPKHVEEYRDCQTKSVYQCHRFEQSVLSILMHTIFRENATNHLVYDAEYYYVCRGCKNY